MGQQGKRDRQRFADLAGAHYPICSLPDEKSSWPSAILAYSFLDALIRIKQYLRS
jgi:hypothetical protein